LKRDRPETLSPAQVLDAIPERNRSVRTEWREDQMVIWVEIRKRWWNRGVMRWLLPFRDEKGVGLDPLGQEVWSACDGRRSVEQIIEQFAAAHKLSFHEARLAVMQFIRSLTERRLLALIVPDESETER